MNRIFEMKKELPLFIKGARYSLDEESGVVYRLDENDKPGQYPLRTGLAGYLWLLRYEGKKYLKEIKL